MHHTGKDTGRGARGHSPLRAAIDTEIELSRDDLGQITAEVTKQRDGPTGYRFCYQLRQVELGLDQDGDPVTTCLVDPAVPAEAGRAGVSFDLWRDACMTEGELSSSENRDTRKRAFNRCREELETAREIVVRDDLVWVVQ